MKKAAIILVILLGLGVLIAQGFNVNNSKDDKKPVTAESTTTAEATTDDETTDDDTTDVETSDTEEESTEEESTEEDTFTDAEEATEASSDDEASSDESDNTDTEQAETETTEDATSADANPLVLKFGDAEMRLDEFNERFRVFAFNLMAQQGIQPNAAMLPEIEPLKPQILDQFAHDFVLLNSAYNSGIELDVEAVDAQIETITASIPEDLSIEDAMKQAGFETVEQLRTLIGESDVMNRFIETIREDLNVDDDAVRAFYDENSEQFLRPEEVCARHILVETEEEANDIVKELDDGKDFAELAAERSTGPSASNGGDLSCFSRGRMVPSFEEAAFAAELNEHTQPVQSDFGYHVILVYEKNDEGLIEFDTVEERIRQVLTDEGIGERIMALYDESGIEVFPEAVASQEPEIAPEDASDSEADSTEAANDDVASDDAEDDAAEGDAESDEAMSHGDTETEDAAEGDDAHDASDDSSATENADDADTTDDADSTATESSDDSDSNAGDDEEKQEDSDSDNTSDDADSDSN